MVKFLVGRILFLVLTLFIVLVVIFSLSEIAPGNIAINSLGNTITPQQEASFNAQNGLDQSVVTRYVRWMIGSDWQAAALIGTPVQRYYAAGDDRYNWWGVGANGVLFQNFSKDGNTMFRLELQPDGATHEVELGPDVWKNDKDGFPVFWGVDQEGHAAMWVKGAQLESWTLTKASWKNSKGAPSLYIPLQYGLLRGDPGVSFFTRRPVAETLLPRIRNTAFLAGIAFLIVMPLALALGLLASLIATATPEFASGVFLILIFSTWLGWFPGAVVTSNENTIFSQPQMLILPIVTLSLIELGYVLRITRSSMVEVMQTNYIRTATLKGLPRWRIVFRHALRNALMAPITVIILHVNWLIGGIVVVETLFGFPGLGRYILEAALFKDVFAIEASAMILVIIAVGTQLFADLIYTYLNPRIRYA